MRRLSYLYLMRFALGTAMLVSVLALPGCQALDALRGKRWHQIPQQHGRSIRRLLWSPRAQRLWIGSQVKPEDHALWSFSPPDGSWTAAPNVPRGATFIDLMEHRGVLWALCFARQDRPGMIWISSDQGETWSEDAAIPGSPDPRCIAALGGQDGAILLGSVAHGFFRTTDGGISWEPSSQGLTNMHVQCLVTDPEDPLRAVAGTLEGLFESDDGGLSWHRLPARLPDAPSLVVDLESSPDAGRTLYVISRDRSGRAHVHRTRDRGRTWDAVQQGLPLDAQPRVLAVHPNRPQTLLLGTVYDGVYRSDDAGRRWRPMNRGLPIQDQRIIVHALAWGARDQLRVYAGTDMARPLWEHPPL